MSAHSDSEVRPSWPYPLRRPALMLLAVTVAAILWMDRTGRLDVSGPWRAHEGERCALVGVVRAQPDVRPTGVVYEVDAETLQPADAAPSSIDGRLLVHVLGAAAATAESGDRVRAFGRISRPATARTPGAFDYRAFLQARAIGAIAYAGPGGFQNLGPSGRNRGRRIGGRIAAEVAACFARRLGPDAAAVLSGLTVGQRPRFRPEVRRAFIESGTMHVLVASGSNVGFIVGALCLVAGALRAPREVALALSLPLVWLYVLVVGGDPPIARAGVMATVFCLARLLGREDRAFHALAVAALSLLLADPRSAFDIGLQMSFLTVFGFLYHLPSVEARIAEWPRAARWFASAMAASVIAQLWLMPISAAVFHRLYPVSLVANLVIVPAASAGLGAGFLLATVDAFGWTSAANVGARAVNAYGDALLAAARFFARHPGTSVWLASPGVSQTAGFFLVALAAPFLRRSWTARVAATAGGALLLIVPPRVARPERWGVAWLDTGTRATAVLVTRAREAVVINPGPAAPADSAERVLGPFFAEAGISRVRAVVVTDPRVTEDDLAALGRVVPVAEVRSATATAPLFGAWDPHGARAPAPIRISGFALSVLPAPPYAGERPLWIARDGDAVLLGHRIELETQGAALERRERLRVVQGRFAPDAVWSPAFLRRFRPALLVDTAGAARESRPPWPAALRRPQTDGWVWWSAPATERPRSDDGGSGESAVPRGESGTPRPGRAK